jgi:hypothetical protein
MDQDEIPLAKAEERNQELRIFETLFGLTKA